MASFESSIPPRTHCSAATSCGGVRSKSSFLGAISVALNCPKTQSPRVSGQVVGERSASALLPTPVTVLADGSDILAVRQAGYQLTRWMTLWTTCATRRLSCAQPGERAVETARRKQTQALLPGKT